MTKQHISILGAGNMATALAWHLGNLGHRVSLYCIEKKVEKRINKKHYNKKYLKGVKLPLTVSATDNIEASLKDAKIVIFAVPSHAVDVVMLLAKPYLKRDTVIVTISKGLDVNTLDPMAVSLQKLLPKQLSERVCMLGGPAIAAEMTANCPTAFVVASQNAKARQTVAEIFKGRNVKTELSDDLLGVGLASALKNAYAIAMGFCDGLNYSTNTKSIIVTLAVDEMSKLLSKAGADTKTSTSLAGLGDLLTTGYSPYGRNRKYGEKLMHARRSEPHKLGIRTVEGIAAADAGLKLAKKLNVKTPLLAVIQKCIRNKKDFSKPFVNYLANFQYADPTRASTLRTSDVNRSR
ncbi:MAG: NAD(P)H-dependent glycerol-3-phosphate dehydrogenase [Patescibacteria group bacterium]|nr:NAD(P)H-dependent glycerol-3-phosphate dehydrogenase [Patescibacteria group bacterium]